MDLYSKIVLLNFYDKVIDFGKENSQILIFCDFRCHQKTKENIRKQQKRKLLLLIKPFMQLMRMNNSKIFKKKKLKLNQEANLLRL